MTGHAPFIGALDTWPLDIVTPDGGTERVAVHGGFISVTDNQVKILSDLAELASQIDVSRAQAAREQAEAAMPRRGADEADRAPKAVAALARANARLAVAAPLGLTPPASDSAPISQIGHLSACGYHDRFDAQFAETGRSRRGLELEAGGDTASRRSASRSSKPGDHGQGRHHPHLLAQVVGLGRRTAISPPFVHPAGELPSVGR